MSKPNTAVFRVVIRGTIDNVWRELTRTDVPQKAMFNSRLHTPGLRPGAPFQMRTPSGRYASVVGEIIECQEPVRYAHTFKFTNYDDPACTVIYDLKEVEEGVEFTLTVENLPEGTQTAKQMQQGGTMIVNTMKAIVENGRPSLGTRLLHVLFKLMEPFAGKQSRVENWPLTTAVDAHSD